MSGVLVGVIIFSCYDYILEIKNGVGKHSYDYIIF